MSFWLQIFLIERSGRKTLLWKSYTVMALALGFLTVTLSLQVRPHLLIIELCQVLLVYFMADIITISLPPGHFLVRVEVFLKLTVILTGLFPPMYMQIKANGIILP